MLNHLNLNKILKEKEITVLQKFLSICSLVSFQFCLKYYMFQQKTIQAVATIYGNYI